MPRGSLLVADAAAYRAGAAQLTPLFIPTATRSLAGYTTTRTHVVLDMLQDVASRLEEWRVEDGRWQRRDMSRTVPRHASEWPPCTTR